MYGFLWIYAVGNLKIISCGNCAGGLDRSGRTAVFIVKDQKSFQKKIVLISDLMAAEGDDGRGQSSCGHDGGLHAQLLLHPVDDPVDHGCAAVHDACSHAVDGVLADDISGDVQADVGQLGRLAA